MELTREREREKERERERERGGERRWWNNAQTPTIFEIL